MRASFVSVWDVCPDTLPPEGMKRAQRLVWLALEGYPHLAADTILDAKNRGRVETIVGDAIRQLDQMALVDPESRVKCYEALVEVALNLAGMEGRRAGFSEEETEGAFKDIVETLRTWESKERPGLDNASKVVTQGILAEMNKVLMGQSMVAEMARVIRKEMQDGDLLASFLKAARREIQENVYFQIVHRGFSKIGNDSATGLRWLRHLGAVQVSSNPVIAARAFEETPELWEKFEAVAASHPEWKRDPKGFADEIAMFATVTSLLPNVLDFRPIALLTDFRDGMVSIQLNPFKAGSTEGSTEDAQKIYGMLEEILRGYDAYLIPDSVFDGRPNVVFKVASDGPAALETTRALNEMGIGTNNTVTFTVAQEVSMVMAAGTGLAQAIASGVPVGRIYITNMEGRLEDHLREVEASRILMERLEGEDDADERIEAAAKRLGAAQVRKAESLEEKAGILCSKKHLKSLSDEWFVELVGRENHSALAQAEKDIRMAGILVTRRAFQLAFAPDTTSKWMTYLRKKVGVSEGQARTAIGMVDLLPASKRRAEDTLLVLGSRKIMNLTNTDFPDQQLRVWARAREGRFKISDYERSIMIWPEASTLKRLLKIEDFRRAYRLTPDLALELHHIGIEVGGEDGDFTADSWGSYGPVVKTMNEFEGAYTKFRNGLMERIGKPAA